MIEKDRNVILFKVVKENSFNRMHSPFFHSLLERENCSVCKYNFFYFSHFHFLPLCLNYRCIWLWMLHNLFLCLFTYVNTVATFLAATWLADFFRIWWWMKFLCIGSIERFFNYFTKVKNIIGWFFTQIPPLQYILYYNCELCNHVMPKPFDINI